MSVISLTKLYDILSDKLGKESAENLTTFIENKIKEELGNKSQTLATKEDLGQAKIDLIKWMFAFWVTIVLMFIGLYIKN